MSIFFKKRFCWTPTETYKTKYVRNGFVWFGFAFFYEGKAYKNSLDLVRAQFDNVVMSAPASGTINLKAQP